MKKRIVSLILALLIAFGSSIGAFAIEENEPAISLTNISGNRMSDISISVNMANNPGIVSLKLNIGYDSNVLELVSVTDTGLLAGKTHAPEYTNNPYILYWADETATENNNANGKLAVLNFKIKEDAPAGDSNVVISIGQDAILNVDMENVNFSFVNGKVTVIVPATKLDITEATATTYVGETVQLTLTKTPADATSEIEWTSSAPGVATVDSTGIVSGVAAGTATITAKSKDDENVKDSCTVTVKAHEHTIETWAKVDDTQHKGTCATCKEVVYENHIAGDGYQHDAIQHNKVCTICHDSYAFENHTYERKILVTEENNKDLAFADGHKTNKTDLTYHVYKCDTCQFAKETEHTEGNTYGHNDTQHWKLCSVCEQPCTEATPHTFVYSSEKSTDTNHVFVCVCGAEKSEVHTPEEAWSTDDNSHWHVCTTQGCTYEVGKEAHTYDQKVVDAKYLKTSASCTSNAIYYKSCVCGKAGTETFEAKNTVLAHQFSASLKQDPTCEEDGWGDYYHCSACGKDYYEETKGSGRYYVINDLAQWKSDTGKVDKLPHEGELVTGQSATCTTPGWKDYYQCKNGCDEYFEEANCATKITDLEAWKTGAGKLTVAHGPGANLENAVAEVPATCEADGVKAYFKCGGCGHYFYDNNGTITEIGDSEAAVITWKTAAGKIAKLGHDYGTPDYIWSENDTKCKASVTCKRDGCENEVTEEVSAIYSMDTAPTCTEAETGHYTATFTNPLFKEQTKEHNGMNPALNHDYADQTVTYTWNDSKTECTASVACKHDGCEIPKTEKATVKYVEDTPATCTEPSKGHYKATFTDSQFEEQSTAANSATNGTAKGHTYGNTTYEWNDDSCTATKTCTVCEDGTEGHTVSETKTGTYVKDTDATCDKAETGHYEVTFADEQFGSDQTDPDSETKGYSLGHQVKYDAESSVAATCTTDGSNVYKCTRCDYSYTEKVAAHHTYGADGVCTGCGKNGLTSEDVDDINAVEAKPQEGHDNHGAKVNTSTLDVLNAVAGNDDIPADVIEQIAEGKEFSLTFTVDTKKEVDPDVKVKVDTVVDEYKEEVQVEEKNGKVTVSAPIEIDFSMILGESGYDIHNLSTPVEVSVPVPEDIAAAVAEAAGYKVEYFVIRIHQNNGKDEISILNAKVENGSLVFETDKFSTFVPMVVVSPNEETPPERKRPRHDGTPIIIGGDKTEEAGKETNPETGAPVFDFGTMAMLVSAAAAFAVSKKRK